MSDSLTEASKQSANSKSQTISSEINKNSTNEGQLCAASSSAVSLNYTLTPTVTSCQILNTITEERPPSGNGCHVKSDGHDLEQSSLNIQTADSSDIIINKTG